MDSNQKDLQDLKHSTKDSQNPNQQERILQPHQLESVEYEQKAEVKQKQVPQDDTSKNIAQKPPKFQKVVEGAYDLSLGISIIVAIGLGFGLGFGLKKLFSYEWLLWLGIFWGICAAISNIYKAYKRQKKALDELAKNPRYNSQAFLKKQKQWDNEDDED